MHGKSLCALPLQVQNAANTPASIVYSSIAGRYRPVSYPDGPTTARYRLIKNAYWDCYCIGARRGVKYKV